MSNTAPAIDKATQAGLTLPPAVIHLAAFASAAVTRVALGNIQIRPLRNGKAEAVATNGHILGRTVFALAESDVLTGEVFVSASALRSLKAKKGERVVLSASPNGASLAVGERSVRLPGAVGFKFPSWEHVVPESSVAPGVKRIGLDTGYIAEVATYCKRCGLKDGQAEFVMPADDLSR